ncbi:hypothetical protein BDR05DRAFT_896215, partial [Suillus weaverae]
FIWDSGGKNSISLETLSTPINEGGKNLLHLQHRNEAIELKWLRGLLAPLEKCPVWASFAQALLARHGQQSLVIKEKAKVHPFLQTWSPTLKKLPLNLKRILRVAKKHNLQWEILIAPTQVMSQLPAWFHIQWLKKVSQFLHVFM